MTNSLFIEILKRIKISDLRDKDKMYNLIEEYKMWLLMSNVLYNKDYDKYLEVLNHIQEFLNEVGIMELRGIVDDYISMFYIMMDENEV